MWTLLLWLNQTFCKQYFILKTCVEKANSRRLARKKEILTEQMTQHLPDYLRRDIGLPPYRSKGSKD